MANANGLTKSRLTVPMNELSTITLGAEVQFISLRLMSETAKLAFSTTKSTIASVDDDETGLLDGTLGVTEINIYRRSPLDTIYLYSDAEVLVQWDHEKL